jgi:predicted RNA binding protein YcfA (HicA-like mRNA interferase family)
MTYRIRLRETEEAVRVFQKLGYRVVRESGHLIMSNGERRLVIPRHDGVLDGSGCHNDVVEIRRRITRHRESACQPQSRP